MSDETKEQREQPLGGSEDCIYHCPHDGTLTFIFGHSLVRIGRAFQSDDETQFENILTLSPWPEGTDLLPVGTTKPVKETLTTVASLPLPAVKLRFDTEEGVQALIDELELIRTDFRNRKASA